MQIDEDYGYFQRYFKFKRLIWFDLKLAARHCYQLATVNIVTVTTINEKTVVPPHKFTILEDLVIKMSNKISVWNTFDSTLPRWRGGITYITNRWPCRKSTGCRARFAKRRWLSKPRLSETFRFTERRNGPIRLLVADNGPVSCCDTPKELATSDRRRVKWRKLAICLAVWSVGRRRRPFPVRNEAVCPEKRRSKDAGRRTLWRLERRLYTVRFFAMYLNSYFPKNDRNFDWRRPPRKLFLWR